MMTSHYDVTEPDLKKDFSCTSTCTLSNYIYFSNSICFLFLRFRPQVAHVLAKIPTTLCKTYVTLFKNTKYVNMPPLPPFTMLSIIKKKGKDDAITRIIWQTQHCYGGEGGYIDYEGNFDEKVLISYFCLVWHIVLHRIVPFLCTHYSKRSNQNNVYYPFLKDLMGNDVTDVSCTSSRIHGKFHTMTSSRDVIKYNGFNMKILKITTISEQKNC